MCLFVILLLVNLLDVNQSTSTKNLKVRLSCGGSGKCLILKQANLQMEERTTIYPFPRFHKLSKKKKDIYRNNELLGLDPHKTDIKHNEAAQG